MLRTYATTCPVLQDEAAGMNTPDKEQLVRALKALAQFTLTTIDQGLKDDSLPRSPRTVLQRRVQEISYTDEGPCPQQCQDGHETEESWHSAVQLITERTLASEPYKALIGLPIADTQVVRQGAPKFVEWVARYRFRRGFIDDAKLESIVDVFVREVSGIPVLMGAQVHLHGVKMHPERIEFDTGDSHIVLRQCRKEDFETREIFLADFAGKSKQFPTAILEFDFPGTNDSQIRSRITQALAILRLFRVGGVEDLSYDMHSDAILYAVGGPGRLESWATPTTDLLITHEDAASLPRHWQIMAAAIPRNFYSGELSIDPIRVAYQRYCGALRSGLIESQIGDAVMGLEGLFVKAEEKELVGLHLRNRCAKALSVFGQNPLAVRDELKDAYNIRSVFLHGHQLPLKARKKLDKEYGSMQSLLLKILNHLRLSILLLMSTRAKSESMNKDNFLNLIDDAFVDRGAEIRLWNTISDAISALNA
jgi:hypothetical protein